MTLLFTLLLAAAAPTAPTTPLVADSVGVRGARTPAYAPDGRLVISLQGHLLVQRSTGAPWVPLTTGVAWDRDPAWTPDGSAIVFASDRSGSYDLWRLEIGVDGRAGALTRLTTTPQAETAPAVASDGRIVFLRGSGNATRLWIKSARHKSSWTICTPGWKIPRT
jgi:dipeptidyl aminopeptidase/acylaminoacyl peptidase